MSGDIVPENSRCVRYCLSSRNELVRAFDMFNGFCLDADLLL